MKYYKHNNRPLSLYLISRLTSTTQIWNGQADTLSFGYDLVDRRISMTDVTGTTTYTYDDLDRLIDLTDSASRSFGFAYDPLNRLTRKTMANGTGGLEKGHVVKFIIRAFYCILSLVLAEIYCVTNKRLEATSTLEPL